MSNFNRSSKRLCRLSAALIGQFTQRIDSGLTYTIEFSNDLINWEGVSGGETYIATEHPLEVIEVPFPASLSNGKPPRFFRVKVE